MATTAIVGSYRSRDRKKREKIQKISTRLALPMMLVSNKTEGDEERGYFCRYVIQSWLVSSRAILFFLLLLLLLR